MKLSHYLQFISSSRQLCQASLETREYISNLIQHVVLKVKSKIIQTGTKRYASMDHPKACYLTLLKLKSITLV
nr:hypothetical protein Iba_chr02cCG11010 [Ipomoea batatas]